MPDTPIGKPPVIRVCALDLHFSVFLHFSARIVYLQRDYSVVYYTKSRYSAVRYCTEICIVVRFETEVIEQDSTILTILPGVTFGINDG